MVGRAADCTRLESERGETHRGFKSLTIRHRVRLRDSVLAAQLQLDVVVREIVQPLDVAADVADQSAQVLA